MNAYFDINTWPMYLLGFLTFCSTIFNDIVTSQIKSGMWYLRDFIYTIISISAGISISVSFELHKGQTWVVVILMGLCGSTIIRKILEKKEAIINNTLNALDIRIQSEIKGKPQQEQEKDESEDSDNKQN
jgi:hypothetical protein|nr:MAG TPA: holin [Caudoviricetes sp.]